MCSKWWYILLIWNETHINWHTLIQVWVEGGGGQSVKKGTNIENLQKIYLRLLKLAKRSPRLDKRIGSIKIDQKIDWTDGTWLIWWLPLAAYCLHHILGKESIRNVGKIDWSDGKRLIWRLPMAAYGSIGSACFYRKPVYKIRYDTIRYDSLLQTHIYVLYTCSICLKENEELKEAWSQERLTWASNLGRTYSSQTNVPGAPCS